MFYISYRHFKQKITPYALHLIKIIGIILYIKYYMLKIQECVIKNFIQYFKQISKEEIS